jgi:cellulose synthase/poly-beta-1,6-N-acetylglucosamine synthase-like glycosyltransferase
MWALAYGYALVALLLALPVLVFAVQVVCAFVPRRQVVRFADRPALAVLMPAHNESDGIARPLNALMAQMQPGDRVLVVADNCSDDTADIARANGAEVIVRHEPERRGKGYALDFGMRHLAAHPPEVVIVIDADCIVRDQAIDKLARYAHSLQRPVQALYLMRSPRGASLKTLIAEFAWAVKNHARPLGYHHLGLPCQLMGTGMAFPWRLMRKAELASGHIVEDLKLGLDLAQHGHAPYFCHGALVTSIFPANSEGAQSQRTRWEHGSLGMLLKEGWPRLKIALKNRNRPLLALALDLCVPPLALLALLTASLGLSGVGLWWATGSLWPWAIGLFDMTLFGGAVLLAWLGFGRSIISLPSLAYAPLYACSKIPLYLRFMLRRQVEWVRSRRD